MQGLFQEDPRLHQDPPLASGLSQEDPDPLPHLAKRIPDSQDPHSRRLEQEDPRCDGIVLLESWTLHGDGIVLLGSWICILGDCPTGIQDSCRQPWT